MKKLIVSDTLRASRDIYLTHLNRKNPHFQPPRYRQYFTRIADSSSDVVPDVSSPPAGPSSEVAVAPSASSPSAVIVPRTVASEPASNPAPSFAIELSTPLVHGNSQDIPHDSPVNDSGDVVTVPRNSCEPESGSSSPVDSFPNCAQRRNSCSPESCNESSGSPHPISSVNKNPDPHINEQNIESRDSSTILPERPVV